MKVQDKSLEANVTGNNKNGNPGRMLLTRPTDCPFQSGRIYNAILLLFILLVFSGCENSLDVIKNMTHAQNYPTVSRQNTTIYYSDSSRVKMRLFATRLERYTQTSEPYTLFPEGVLVYFYDSAMNIQTEISAKYARYDESKNLWEAKNDVVCKNNIKGEQLNTEELFWDDNKHMIYSDKFSRIQTPDGVFIGESGFIANEGFSWWQLKGTRGTVNMKDEQ